MGIEYPSFFKSRIFSNQDAVKQTVKSGYAIGSGFATSEPLTFYQGLWDYIKKEDIVDLDIRQGLFMAAHKLCVGDALSARGWFENSKTGLAKKLNAATRKLDGLGLLIAHYRELQERRITFTSGFISAPTSMMVPENFITRLLYREFAGRNSTRMGITDMQSVHFPNAVEGIAYDPDSGVKVNTFILVMTPPDRGGEMSHGPANGANHEILERILANRDADVLLYINPNYPFTYGYNDAANTININDFKGLADSGRLFAVLDNNKVPALPAGSFENPAPEEIKIAEQIVNHIEMNKQITYGRAIQVGIGGAGVQAVKALKNSGWSGRGYSEMLEPFMLELMESGKIKGSHFIETGGARTQLDGKIVCTFSVCEEGSGFYKKLDQNHAVVIAAASRVVIPEAFYHGLGINNCLAVDFQGHINSGGRGNNHHSGIGGAAMIMRGLAKGGVGYMCLKSTFRGLDGRLQSSIVPYLERGTPISLVGPDLTGGREGARIYLATEHGIARISGKSQSEFIESIISVADPRFKTWLKKEAYKEFRVAV